MTPDKLARLLGRNIPERRRIVGIRSNVIGISATLQTRAIGAGALPKHLEKPGPWYSRSVTHSYVYHIIHIMIHITLAVSQCHCDSTVTALANDCHYLCPSDLKGFCKLLIRYRIHFLLEWKIYAFNYVLCALWQIHVASHRLCDTYFLTHPSRNDLQLKLLLHFDGTISFISWAPYPNISPGQLSFDPQKLHFRPAPYKLSSGS